MSDTYPPSYRLMAEAEMHRMRQEIARLRMSYSDTTQWPDQMPLEKEARALCKAAGDDPNRPRWMDYIEQARATIAAREAAKNTGIAP